MEKENKGEKNSEVRVKKLRKIIITWQMSTFYFSCKRGRKPKKREKEL